jgi:hypothetical protein
MKLTGNSSSKTDTIARATEIFKNRPMPRPRIESRRNVSPKASEITAEAPLADKRL